MSAIKTNNGLAFYGHAVVKKHDILCQLRYLVYFVHQRLQIS